MTDTALPDRRCPGERGAAGIAAWYFPTEASDNRQLERWCTVVGPLVVDSLPGGAFGPMGAGDPLTLAVWNTDAGAGDLMGFLELELGLACAGASSTLRPAASHFILVLQEALRRSPALDAVDETWATPPPVAEEDRPGPRLDVIQVARQCGLALFYAPAARNGHDTRDGSGEDKGNAILATVPLTDLVVIELPFESARRVVVGTTTRSLAGDALRVLSVHLITTPQAWRVLTTANSARVRQAAALVNVLDRIERIRGLGNGGRWRGVSTVLAGDFNTWSQKESALRLLLRNFPDSPRPLMDRTRGPFPADHLLLRHHGDAGPAATLIPGSYRRVANRFYSDHNPIVARFRFGRDTS
jgi:endonuclease/exonuclease/phosphatase family metal-dependent hydrolase